MGMSGANSTEFDKDTKYPVIDIMVNQKKCRKYGWNNEIRCISMCVERWNFSKRTL